MSIHKIQHPLFVKRATNSSIHLKEGQIVKGKVMKLYSNHRAEIRIGTTTLIAQLETSLSVGKDYYFQVQEKNNQIYLQVAQGERHGKISNLQSLMKQMQIKETSMNTLFLEKLITNGIPFNRAQLVQAIKLLQASPEREIAMDVLQYMIENKFPMVHSIFQALIAIDESDVTTRMESLYKQLQHDSIPISERERTLIQLLQPLIARPNNSNIENAQIILSNLKKEATILHLFRLLGLVDPSLNRKDTISRLQQYIDTSSVQNYPLQQISSDTQLQQIFSQAQNEMKQLIHKESEIIRTALKIVSIFHPIQTASLNQKEFQLLLELIRKEFMPLLPPQMQQSLANRLQSCTVQDQQSVLTFIQAFMNQDGYTTLSSILTNIDQHQPSYGSQVASIQHQFMTHLTNYIQTIGLTMDYDIIQALRYSDDPHHVLQTNTVKSLLIQMIQQGGMHQEQIQALIHFINGLQLQAFTETNQLYQAQLVIPGNNFSLNEDIWLQFESKKTPEKEINTDYCHIVFVLNLKELQETIVDMQIQQRIITVTIFNDLLEKIGNTDQIHQIMKENLEAIHYQLSTVQWKALSNQSNEVASSIFKKENNYQQEGFDFRI